MEKSACRGCGKEILWYVTAEGKRIPFDAKQTQFLTANNTAHPDQSLEYGVMFGHVNHFITCPQRDQFRKPK